MNLRTAIATATTAAVLATGGVALAGASTSSSPSSTQTSVTTPPAAASPAATPATPRIGVKVRLRIRRAIRRGAARIVTETVHIDKLTLRADLLAGQTIADIASAHGVAPQTVITALVTAATTKVDAAAHARRITTARAHRIDQRLPALVTKIVNTWLPKRARTTAP